MPSWNPTYLVSPQATPPSSRGRGGDGRCDLHFKSTFGAKYSRLAEINTPYYLDDARFSILARTSLRDNGYATASGDDVPAHALISQAKSLQDAAGAVLEALVKQVASMLQTDPSEIDTSGFLHSFGIDSLVAIEIVKC